MQLVLKRGTEVKGILGVRRSESGRVTHVLLDGKGTKYRSIWPLLNQGWKISEEKHLLLESSVKPPRMKVRPRYYRGRDSSGAHPPDKKPVREEKCTPEQHYQR